MLKWRPITKITDSEHIFARQKVTTTHRVRYTTRNLECNMRFWNWSEMYESGFGVKYGTLDLE